MGSPVEVSSVSYPDGGRRLLAQHLDEPQSGGSPARGYALDVRGWVVGADAAAREVELLAGDSCLARVPVDIERGDIAASYPDAPGSSVSGFFLTCNTLRVPASFELSLPVTLADGTVTELAHIAGERAPLRPSFSPTLQPLMVTTMGRTGSTMLVQLLGEHPDVVTAPPFEYEPKVASYWAEVLLALSEPASYRRQLSPGRNLTDRWWLGDPTPLPRPIHQPDVAGWIGEEAVTDLVDFCLGRVEALYSRIATGTGKPNARYFAEKLWGASEIPRFIWELYPQGREVFVVRDFRDMLASMYAFNEMKGYEAFQRQFTDSDLDHIQELGRRASRLLDAFRARRDTATLVRYEDLVHDPDSTLAGLLERLELDAAPATILSMRDGLRRSDVDRHVTTDDPEQSIGRWKRDLAPEVQNACETAFAPALEGFGYG